MNPPDDGIGPTATTADLRVVLADALGRHFGGNRGITRLTRRQTPTHEHETLHLLGVNGLREDGP